MTKKEAIQTFKHWIEYEKGNKEKINKADELIEIQETILKALEQKDKEIQELKNEKEILSTLLKQAEQDIEFRKELLEWANADRVEKDKIIKLMAKFMNKRSWKEHQLKDDDCYCCKIEYSSKECVDCIIGYFQKKVSKENE